MTRLPLPNVGGILAPILPALPAASLSTQPATAVLPFLSPILRQRVQVFSATSTEPWLRLLSYDTSKASRLVEVVQSGRLDPHPVSGEVEVDWEYDTKTRYRRLDQETSQALVVLEDLELTFQLVYCVGDKDGGGDGWRVAELGVVEKPDPFAAFGGYSTIAEAEKAFEENRPKSSLKVSTGSLAATPGPDDEDDGYWDRYDATPARSPVNHRSPAPPKSTQPGPPQPESYRPDSAADDDYYAMYDDVQPAMDNHDPEEEAAHMQPNLNIGHSLSSDLAPVASASDSHPPYSLLAQPRATKPESPPLDAERAAVLLHPRPASSASSNGSRTVEKLEETAERQMASEFSVKKHVSRTIRSLWMLSQASGIDREEFDRLVRSELEVLEMVDNHDLS
ncbi:hypothetical protein SODALDRAFT_281500 [Sodiomyces alkalinus F11]|uniref:Uncharacterized protein n=1 Tax=Sodiomyces alkalinus (strain CBS 110278 / VKM F-3762 / F11) TaxID=1314773 RepID=A0A3N2PQK6_SODAK|nr:hypothetical protein SODALDRAFT_281500 [Sodiomyces alkalinus F11]ROT36801.1 hypothetical protein SODALDRAFT_281500 [Sodiomyces alkalinus F11]